MLLGWPIRSAASQRDARPTSCSSILGIRDLIPLNDPTNQLVHTENGGAVDHVMIGGRMVLQGGRFTTADIPEIRRKVAERVAALAEMNRETRMLLHSVEAVLEQFCVGLARQPYHVDHVVCG